MKTIFVGGPIQYAINTSGQFNLQLKKVIESILKNLKANNFKILSAHRYENYGELDVTNQKVQVCKRDFQWMNECDIFIAILLAGENGAPLRTDGTCIELGWASALKKKIIIVQSKDVEYSHLVNGLHGVANVSFLEINELIAMNYNISSIIVDTKPLKPISINNSVQYS